MSDKTPERDFFDGGPAFPFRSEATGPWEGMSLRDWFAGQALVGTLTHYGRPVGDDGARLLAISVYVVADAMLKERERGPNAA